MLKFANTEKTCATFNGTFLALAAPEDWASIGDVPTRDAVLAWLDAGNTPEPIDPPSLADLWEKIKARRDHLSATGGYKVVVAGEDKWFHSDAKSKIQQIGLVLMGAAVSSVPPWKTMDGTFVAMTQALAGQIFAAAATMDGALFAVAEAHRTAMLAAPDPAAYDFSTGWPAVYVPA